jgi:hypothetical protein
VIRAACLAACLAACGAPAASAPAASGPAAHASCGHARPARCTARATSFEVDVGPVLEKRCFSCHANGGSAAEDHDFSNMERLKADRAAIADQVASCAMPPRSPLDDADANTLLAWASCAP